MIGAALQRPVFTVDDRFARFAGGDARDPTGTIRLADDLWDLRAYYHRLSATRSLSVSFGTLTVLGPYAKWYALDRILIAGHSPRGVSFLVGALVRAEQQMAQRGITSIDALAAPDVFAEIWMGLVDPWPGPLGTRPRGSVWRQHATHPFWRALRHAVGVPTVIPPVLPFARPTMAETARRDGQAIPEAVIRQLGNRLALHRDGRDPLTPRDLFRLALLLLHIALGRRISEILLAPRGAGPRGPLLDYDTTSGDVALGFRFEPNKDGVDDIVFVSDEWRDLVEYCVSTLVRFSDEVRHTALPEDVDRLVLVSGANGTRTRGEWTVAKVSSRRASKPLKPASVLPYYAFQEWLNGGRQRKISVEQGAMSRWDITTTGRAGDPIYRMRTHAARHTRQTALRADPRVSRLAAQRDLNTASVDAQNIYQHGLAIQNRDLRQRASAAELIGRGATWIAEIDAAGYEPGEPALVSERPRVLALLAANPALMEFNRVPTGYCVRPQGPAACPEFLQCVEAAHDGCAWYATDPSDERCVTEVVERAADRRFEADAAAGARQRVLAGKLETLASRAEAMQSAVVAAAPQSLIAKLRARLAIEDPK